MPPESAHADVDMNVLFKTLTESLPTLINELQRATGSGSS